MKEIIPFDKLSGPYYFRYRRKPSVQSLSHAISSHPILWTRLQFNILFKYYFGSVNGLFYVFFMLLGIYYNIYIGGIGHVVIGISQSRNHGCTYVCHAIKLGPDIVPKAYFIMGEVKAWKINFDVK